ncbi:hypothetical protein SUGI_0854420 [Cryptomeria japonica]|nr:hypothetical protein SUGI_0854420 [Cryptomeria japonica]
MFPEEEDAVWSAAEEDATWNVAEDGRSYGLGRLGDDNVSIDEDNDFGREVDKAKETAKEKLGFSHRSRTINEDIEINEPNIDIDRAMNDLREMGRISCVGKAFESMLQEKLVDWGWVTTIVAETEVDLIEEK